MADQRDEVLNFINANGPVLPVQVAKHLNTQILFGSAILSELVERRMLKITSAAIGGSPIYYLPGQEALMDEKLATSLGGREKQAYQLIKERKIVLEKALEPWERVAIKSLKDFVTEIKVNLNGNVEVFWKHNLVTDDSAKLIIPELLTDYYGVQEEPVQEPMQTAAVTQPQQTQFQVPVQPSNPGISFREEEEIEEKPMRSPTTVTVEEKAEEENDLKEFEDPEIKLKELKKDKKPEGKFYQEIVEFIKDNKAEILKEEIIKKDKELEFIINIPTNFGILKYLLKAKNKPAINETDVSMAFSDGQMKKLPVILLVNGKVNKKATAMVELKMHGQLVIKEM
jgi:hypothetical protein